MPVRRKLVILTAAGATAESVESCNAYGDRPAMPDKATDMNGVAWPQGCYSGKDSYHVFVLGDWGGMCGYGEQNDCTLSPEEAQASWDHADHPFRPYPMPNRRGAMQGVDQAAQLHVRDRMNELAAEVDPEFVLNVGDSFYPGGIVEHCMGRKEDIDFHTIPTQFKTTFEDIYNGTGLQNKEWLSVLGNHDYGGVCYNMGWPQQIWYTWNDAGTKRWIMPGQYFSRTVRFGSPWEGFWADMWFLDSNVEDTNKDAEHDICSADGNMHNADAGGHADGWFCKGFLGDWENNDNNGVCEGLEGFQSHTQCNGAFRQLWEDQMTWLENGLRNSKADWQIIVTHFPAYYPALQERLKPLAERYGVDLIISGHVHAQEIWYQREAYGQDWGDTALLISGGGGGIFSEGTPSHSGHDNQYGFMDMEMSKDKIIVSSYSWGVQNQQITVHMQMGADTALMESHPLTPPMCCWNKYFGCEDYPGWGGYGLCSNDWTKGCNDVGDCPAPPAPPPSQASDCSGAFQATGGMHNEHVKYEGGPNNQCIIYWDAHHGWVLNSDHGTNNFVCSGGKAYKFPTGRWEIAPQTLGVRSCSVEATQGERIRMMNHEIRPRQAQSFDESLLV